MDSLNGLAFDLPSTSAGTNDFLTVRKVAGFRHV
jgi:hypothetical protein